MAGIMTSRVAVPFLVSNAASRDEKPSTDNSGNTVGRHDAAHRRL